MPRKKKVADHSALQHVHETTFNVSRHEITPPHPPREETPIYKRTHHRLVIEEDRPCFVCGVRYSDLQDPARRADRRINPYQATDQESHHWPLERSLMEGIDPELLARDFPTVRQFKTLEEWVDSEFNMLICCSACHRTADHAIHHSIWQDVIATKYARQDKEGDRYQFVANDKDVAQAEALDEKIEKEAGLE